MGYGLWLRLRVWVRVGIGVGFLVRVWVRVSLRVRFRLRVRVRISYRVRIRIGVWVGIRVRIRVRVVVVFLHAPAGGDLVEQRPLLRQLLTESDARGGSLASEGKRALRHTDEPHAVVDPTGSQPRLREQNVKFAYCSVHALSRSRRKRRLKRGGCKYRTHDEWKRKYVGQQEGGRV